MAATDAAVALMVATAATVVVTVAATMAQQQ
jgi:hypothetical protein